MDLDNSERANLLRKHKAAIRRAMILAAQEIAPGSWTEEDDAQLDAATTWLYRIFKDAPRMEWKNPVDNLLSTIKGGISGT